MLYGDGDRVDSALKFAREIKPEEPGGDRGCRGNRGCTGPPPSLCTGPKSRATSGSSMPATSLPSATSIGIGRRMHGRRGDRGNFGPGAIAAAISGELGGGVGGRAAEIGGRAAPRQGSERAPHGHMAIEDASAARVRSPNEAAGKRNQGLRISVHFLALRPSAAPGDGLLSLARVGS